MAITGTWWNQLGSKLELVLDPNDVRQLSGKYHTNVGQAQQRTYPLVGRCDDGQYPDRVLSWVVVWDPPDPPANPNDPPNKPSITAWAGQYHVDQETQTEFITTAWLLSRMTKAEDDWKSTLVSMDFFFRKQPSPQAVARARKLGKAAPHFTDPVA